MIAENINGDKWKQTTVKKLLSFCEKCPCVLSIKTAVHQGDDGVFVIHKNTGMQYFFPWDFNVEPKDFIHNIKSFLEKKHYPILIETITEEHKLTKEELALMVEEGKSIQELPQYEKRIKEKKLWRIDKVILWKDIVILVQIDNKGNTISNQYRYKYNKNLVIFLKKYRSGEYADLEEAGNEFFNNSILVNEITPKE
jgi:hypothetical protein